jgi:PAS domain S-box-containing protein
VRHAVIVVRVFTSAVALLGLVAVAAIAATLPIAGTDLLTALVLVFAAIAAVLVPLRFHHGRGVHGFTLEEGVFVALLFTVPAGAVPALMVVGSLLGHGAQRRELPKLAFNVGQVGLWATAGTLVFHAIGPGAAVLDPRSLLAVVAALATLNAVSLSLVGVLFSRLEGVSFRDVVAPVWRVNLLTAVGNGTFGLILALVVLQDPLGGLIAALLMIGLYVGFRGYAGMLEDQERVAGLHEVTRVMADATAPTTPGEFLERTAGLFSGRCAELVYLTGGRCHRYVWDEETGHTSEVLDAGAALVAQLTDAGRARHITVGSDDPWAAELAGTGNEEALVAPVAHEEISLGRLAVYDRRGLESWDDTDARFLAALAHEVSVAIRNVELFTSLRAEKARLAEETQKLRDVIGAASDGIAYVDASGAVQTWNPGMVDATGIPADEAMGRHWGELLYLHERSTDDDPRLAPLLGALGGQATADPVDLRVRRHDGHRSWLRCTFSPVRRDGHVVVGAVIVARDVTRERELEDLKSDFVSTVSHELRTPLTPLKGFLLTLTDGDVPLSQTELDAAHDAMLRQVERLERLLLDLILVADLGTDQVRLKEEPVHVDEVVAEAAASLAGDDDARRVEITSSPAPRARTDRAALARIVQCLVENGLKHTDGLVQVDVRAEGDDIRVRVSDEGGGIPLRDQRRVFERFTRLGGHLTRPTQGAGLGLYIARTLSERIGGRLELDSAPGRGSAFTVVLPVRADEGADLAER